LLAHGAVAAGWVAQEAPKQRAAVAVTCVRAPTKPLHISPARELLAFTVTPIEYDHGVIHP